MQVTDRDIRRIPAGNIHVPRAQFAAVWAVAEAQAERTGGWYPLGVAVTCRWLADATVPRPEGGWRLQAAPVTERRGTAYEELVDAECVAAEKMLLRRPPAVWVVHRPGYVEAVAATLGWAWRHAAPPPVDAGNRVSG